IDKKIGILREVVELYEFKKQIDNATSRDETTSLRSSETFKSNEETLKTILEEKENELKENELKKLEEEINSMTDTDELEKVMDHHPLTKESEGDKKRIKSVVDKRIE